MDDKKLVFKFTEAKLKKYKFNIKNQTLTVTFVAFLIGSALLSTMASCSKNNDQTDLSSNNTSNESSITDNINNTGNSEISNTSESTSTSKKIIRFMWEYHDTETLEKTVMKKFNMTIRTYISCYGFTDDFKQVYVDYINNKLNTDYTIDDADELLKISNYFFGYIMSDNDIRHKYDNYDKFKIRCLNNEKARLSAFNNKLIFSYLIQNNIKLGEFIDIDHLKAFMTDEIYKYGGVRKELIIKNPKTGNYDKSYIYNKYELYELLLSYNSAMYSLCADNSIKTCNIFEKPEALETCNQNLEKFYGKNAPKIGEVPTADTYRAMFGEDPLDLSYIPGAVMQTPQ